MLPALPFLIIFSPRGLVITTPGGCGGQKKYFLFVLFLCIEAVFFGLLSFGKQQAEERYIGTVLEQHRRERRHPGFLQSAGPFRGGELPFSVAISFGVVRLAQVEILGQVMTRADGLMYESKIRKKSAARNGGPASPCCLIDC